MDGLSREIYELISSLPPASAQVVAGMIVNEGLHWDLAGVDVDGEYLLSKGEQMEDIKRAIIRSYVSKRSNGEDIDSLVALSDVISKAELNPGFHGESQQQRREAQRNQPRASGGRYGRVFHEKKNGKEVRRPMVDTIGALQESWEQASNAVEGPRVNQRADRLAFVPGARNAQRVGTGASFLQGSVGGYLPPSAQAGLETASFVGRFGSQAQLAFGPSIDRAKYRYKGTENRVDPTLKQYMKQGVGTPKQWRTNRDTLINGETERDRNGDPIAWIPSPTMRYIRDKWLPELKLSALQRSSGHIPPSRGIILDSKGQISTEMVGHGDDWFVPFDLRNLGNLKGGEYIRTRTNGGLTTEDVYTGLMTGARSMTVVSRNGVFTMDFDDSLRGQRRYSQSAREMTERYGKLLDAVKSRQVTYETLDPSRMDELRSEANGDYTLYEQLIDQEYEKPRASASQKVAWGDEFLDTLAERRGFTGGRLGGPTGRTISPRQEMLEKEVIPRMAQDLADEENKIIVQSGGVPVYSGDEESFKDQARNLSLAAPNRVADVLGVTAGYQRHVDQQEMSYLRGLEPLQLDGPGYNYAMQALKEQFPYFIKDAQWHPWEENKMGAGKDLGYVMPRYVRPKAANAGYYDTDILGYGKVPASYTRYQNARVTQTIETGYQPKDMPERLRRDDRREETQGAPRSPEGAPQEREEEKPKESTPEQAVNQRLRNKSVLDAFSEQTNFGKLWTNPGREQWAAGQRGTPIAGHLGEGGIFRASPGYDLFTPDGIEATRKMPLAEQTKRIKQMIDLQSRDKIFDGNAVSTAIDDWQRGDAKPRLRTRDDIDPLEPDLGSTAETFDFGEAFAAGRSKRDYQNTYYQDPNIRRIRRVGGIGDIQQSEVPQQIADFISEQQSDIVDAHDRGEKANQEMTNIFHALMTLQLHRFYNLPGGPQHAGPAAGPRRQGPRRPVDIQHASLPGRLQPVSQQQYGYISSGQLRQNRIT